MNKAISTLDTTTLQKVTLRHVYVEIGRACNLACEHCCKGESQNVQMSDEVMEKANEFCCEAKYEGALKMLEIATACYQTISDEYKGILSGFTFAYENAKKAGAVSDEAAYQQMATKYNIPYEQIVFCSEFLKKLRLAVEEMQSMLSTARYVIVKREDLGKSGSILQDPDDDMSAGGVLLSLLAGAGIGLAAIAAYSKKGESEKDIYLEP